MAEVLLSEELEAFLLRERVLSEFVDNVIQQKTQKPEDEEIEAIVGAFDWGESNEKFFFWNWINKKFREFLRMRATLTIELIETEKGPALFQIDFIDFYSDTNGVNLESIKGIDFNSYINQMILKFCTPEDN